MSLEMRKHYKRFQLTLCVFFLASVLLVISSEPVQAKTYREGKTYTLTGKLRRRTYRHGGNGTLITGYTIQLGKKVKIVSSRYNNYKGKELDINVNMLSSKNYAKLKKWVGKKVKVRGIILIPDNLYWWYNGGLIVASKVTKR